MRYISTRGKAPELGFDDVLITGLARDGGLYVPGRWPRFSDTEIGAMAGLDYPTLATRIMAPFVDGAITRDDIGSLIRETYAEFDHAAVAPLKHLDSGLWLMELFHGPTLAFKDYAMQVLGRLFDITLRRRGQCATIIGATSGDTGSAAIEAFRDRQAVDIFILFPKGRVSRVQQRQMTTVDAPNVHAVAIEGTFDDCQDLVKALFNDLAFRDRYQLSAINSINWARILPQVVYYFWAALALGAPHRRIAFSVPSGNFGNVYAGYVAAALGLPVQKLIIGTNANDILSRFFRSGTMEIRGVKPTLSPSMDIQVSSNFERLLFDLYDRNGASTAVALDGFRETGSFSVSSSMLARAQDLFEATAVDDAETVRRIGNVHSRCGDVLDPHSAVGVEAAARSRRAGALDPTIPIVSLACAHPAKFPEAVADATGLRPALPPRLATLMTRREHITVLANDFRTVAGHIAATVGNRENAA